jgi:hypothetical protein
MTTMRRMLFAGILVLAMVTALTPLVLLPALAPDASTPPEVERLLPDAKRYLSGQLDLVAAHIRYTGVELREHDQLVILEFELRPFPYLAAEGAYLVSRCTALEELDPFSMGGGRGVQDFATDPELAHARSGAQPPCANE